MATTTTPMATTANENTPPVMTQNTVSAVETLFLIKQEERCKFLHNSANKTGHQALEDGTKARGMTREQREADDSAIEQQAAIARKPHPVNPHTKKMPSDPPVSQPSPPPFIGTNATTATPSQSTAVVATTASLPREDGDNSDDDSDEELAKTMSSNLINNDCMLFLEEERRTLGTNRGKNTGACEQRKIAI